jgi:hypothetical protein
LFSKENLNTEGELHIRKSLGISDKGSHVWELYQIISKEDGSAKTYVSCTLIRKERHGGWGEKHVGNVGDYVYHYDCPKKFIDAMDKTPDVLTWIENCEKFRALQNMRKKLAANTLVRLHDLMDFGYFCPPTKKFKLLFRMGKQWVGSPLNEQGELSETKYRFLPQDVVEILS